MSWTNSFRLSLATPLAAILPACSGCSKVPEAVPPSMDSPGSASDASKEGGLRDAGAEAGVFDGGVVDAGFNPFVGRWSLIPGAPPSCDALVADDPASSVGPLKWERCASGRSGCRQLVVNWTTEPGHVIDVHRTDVVRLVQSTPYIVYRRLYIKNLIEPLAYIDVVQPLDQNPLFATGAFTVAPNPCGPTTSIGERGIAIEAHPPGAPAVEVLTWSSWSQPVTLTTALVDLTQFGLNAGGYIQHSVIGTDAIYLETKYPDSIDVFSLVDRRVIVPRVPMRIPAEQPRTVAEGALVQDFLDPYSIDLLKSDGSYDKLVAPSAPHAITSLAVDRSSPSSLVWVESDGDGPFTNEVIWVSPYASTAAGIARRKVALLADTNGRGGGSMVANRGVVLNVVADQKAVLTRLSDGMGWDIHADSGSGFVDALWVDDDEVWLSTASLARRNFRAYTSGIVRIARSSLGLPTVSPGF